jgi:hypothetical protein
VCQKVGQLLSGSEFSSDLMSLPLSRLYDVDCEWDGGSGRTVQRLTAFVRETCEKQVRYGGTARRAAYGDAGAQRCRTDIHAADSAA